MSIAIVIMHIGTLAFVAFLCWLRSKDIDAVRALVDGEKGEGNGTA